MAHFAGVTFNYIDMKHFHSLQKNLLLLLIISFTTNIFSQIPAEYILWEYNCGEIYSGPLLIDSVLYIGDFQGKFSKLNANTGEEIWSYQAETYIASNATIKDDIVVFEAGDRLHGLNAQSGELLWSFRSTDKESTPGYPTGYHHSSPVIEGNTAYYGDEWGYMNGVNIETGELDFQYHIPYEYSTVSDYNIRSTPVIQDSIIYFGDYDGVVYAISLKDKSEKWITKMETPRWDGSIVSEMVINDGTLYCGRYTNAFIPLDLETGTPLWKFSDNETFLPSTPLFYKNQIVIGTTIHSNHIYSLDKVTGEKNWEIMVKGIFFNKPILIQDSVLVMNSTDPFTDLLGVMYFINLNKGKIINEIPLTNSTESYPIQYKNYILIGKGDGLYAINYLPYLGDLGPSNFSFDDSEDSIKIKTNESYTEKYPVTNNSIFSDNYSLLTEIVGGKSKSQIFVIERTNFHLMPSQEDNILVRIVKNKVAAGEYTMNLTLTSDRQEGDYLFKKTIHILIEQVTGIESSIQNSIKIYPNPFNEKVTFDLGESFYPPATITIYNTLGAAIYSTEINGKKLDWNGLDKAGNPLSKGIYIYSFQSKDYSLTGELVKN